MHPFIVGEIALGYVRHRDRTLALLELLPMATVAGHAEVLKFIASQKIFGLGIGYVDVHLLVATRLTPETKIWTYDRRLHAAAERMKLAFAP